MKSTKIKALGSTLLCHFHAFGLAGFWSFGFLVVLFEVMEITEIELSGSTFGCLGEFSRLVGRPNQFWKDDQHICKVQFHDT